MLTDIDGNPYPVVTCHLCTTVQEACYVDEVKDKMVAERLCFACLFWLELIEENRGNPRCFVAEGTHWTIGAEEGGRLGFRGLGGTKMWVTFLDGRPDAVTTNLWCQGDVPERFRDQLPDTATVESDWSRNQRILKAAQSPFLAEARCPLCTSRGNLHREGLDRLRCLACRGLSPELQLLGSRGFQFETPEVNLLEVWGREMSKEARATLVSLDPRQRMPTDEEIRSFAEDFDTLFPGRREVPPHE